MFVLFCFFIAQALHSLWVEVNKPEYRSGQLTKCISVARFHKIYKIEESESQGISFLFQKYGSELFRNEKSFSHRFCVTGSMASCDTSVYPWRIHTVLYTRLVMDPDEEAYPAPGLEFCRGF